ncbi:MULTISPECIES: saccharopine dehydrogenase family protein [Acinetobacter]|uniref:Saccharopine dehydrogenase n=1 Tax=Acinetobacter baumannii TaxID=470 RepID=A0A6I4IL45_ACIBA|nr:MULTISPECIES: saccharopine dehydrogenase NADP-binding domain-containing protein [Acinetobacter]AIL80836.1 saccharopine dehydrogenase [Acinetobacter baumannii]AIS06585.1 saccharopine dehydrogenase [Acinetobacter baumannii]APJ19489.1 saccharopine dehydrogenase [Acinetobacter baumannii]ATD21310.1 saccharopine dehydrogenase [Acinetobacter baumannii]AVE55295.1 saccharopine dehydrogenase [Acinetobacter baumannii]
MSRRIIFIGAAGEMCRLAIERFAKAKGDWELVLCDIRPELLSNLVEKLPQGLATTQHLDLYDKESLQAVVNGADLVVLGAGPYIRTSAPVIEACLEAKVPYLDFDDDVESTEHALSLHEKAKEAGIPIYVGCGASPGMANVLVVDAANELDTVENIDCCWMVGDERPGIGRAVLEHFLHITAGDCLTWENGKRVNHETFVETGTAPMGGGLGEILMYETAHPEPVTLPRKYPTAQRIRCLGGLHPAPFNGLGRGVGLAVHHGEMTVKEGVDFLEDLLNNKLGSAKGWKAAISGMIGQVKRKESSFSAMVEFLTKSAIGKTYPYKGGLLARVYGTKNGRPAVAIRRTVKSGEDSYLMRDMAAITGTACAAFMVLALDETGKRSGTFAPEDWAEPEAFYTALERVGTPRAEIVESVL